MSKQKVVYVCSQCGAQTSKWQGKCFSCGSFGTLERKTISGKQSSSRRIQVSSKLDSLQPLSQVETTVSQRMSSGLRGLDHVLGGGIVAGSAVLLAGGPGLGKSTLLLQLASQAETSLPALYISAEESLGQIKLRARRLSVDQERLVVVSETDIEVILDLIKEVSSRVGLVVVDSIQALSSHSLDSFAGSVTQVRESARRLSLLCKELSLPLFLVGHVTKKGSIAGPKTLEHLVDVVLYLEGEKSSKLRLLRSLKNRFGNVFGMAVFRMEEKGLLEINDPSATFLAGRRTGIPGSVITVALEGFRPLVLEVQALTTPCGYERPARNVTGIARKRLLMLLAVLRKRAGINLSQHNVFVNLSGGVKVFEPGIDLPVCVALVSSVKNKEVDEKLVAFGEVGLLGEVKEVSYQQEREKEARRMGFTRIVSGEEMGDLGEVLKAVGL